MARGDQQSQGAAGQSNANANTFMGNANALYGQLTPQLESEVAHPAGYSPEDLAAMETGALQSAGGSQASAVGQGGLLAARTRNSGAAAAAIPEASRAAGQNLSQSLLGIRSSNAQLKERERQAGLSGLEGLTGTETGASNTALGNVASNVNANNGAVKNSWNWATDILDPTLQAASNSKYF